jgi:hypothetical protein
VRPELILGYSPKRRRSIEHGALWDSAEAIEAAKKAVTARYAAMGFSPQEMVARLGTKADLATYRQVDAQDPLQATARQGRLPAVQRWTMSPTEKAPLLGFK